MATPTEVGIEDIAGVKSRVSWGAIVGGSVVALATYVGSDAVLCGYWSVTRRKQVFVLVKRSRSSP